jgi:predicted RNA binding protein YcfA (HicA-like mRNA interferase family)
MSKIDKLLKKLNNETISADELRTLLKQLGWVLDRTRGSHEIWVKESKTYVLATHKKELKPYLIKQAKVTLEV